MEEKKKIVIFAHVQMKIQDIFPRFQTKIRDSDT